MRLFRAFPGTGPGKMTPAADAPPLVGRPAAPFVLRDAGGRLHRLEAYRGRWLLLVFHRHLF